MSYRLEQALGPLRHDWSLEEVRNIYNTPLLELIYEAQTVHRANHPVNKVQVSSLISIKTGGCPEDCHYCPQAARYHTDINSHKLMPLEQVEKLAQNAKDTGSSRVCLGAAWREVKDNQDFENVLTMVKHLNNLDLEVCCTLGMLTEDQAHRLKEAGIYAYNHNIDTSESHYEKIITTRTFDDRLDTLQNVRKAKITVCSGGIIGLGETQDDRLKMLLTLSALTPHPESVPINSLVAVKGTPLEHQEPISVWEKIRTIATARMIMPKSMVRLSAGRLEMSMQEQLLCFMAGANSIFAGEKLLTTPNPDAGADETLFATLGLERMQSFEHVHAGTP